MDLSQQIADGHGYLGYIVAAAVLGSQVRAMIARNRGEDYSSGAARLAGLLLALQFLYGILVYVQGSYWNFSWLVAYLHPLLMLGAMGAAGAATARAGRAATAYEAWTEIFRMHLIASVLVIAGIGAATAGLA